MGRSKRLWLGAIAILVTACGSDDTPGYTTCLPNCPGSPVQAGDSGGSAAPVADAGSALPAVDAGALLDSGRVGPAEAGVVVPPDGGAPAQGDASVMVGDAMVMSEAGAAAGGGSMLPPVTDYTKAGPFKTTMTANVGPSNNYTIFRPEPLGENGFVHSPIIFGPGILTTASTYRTMLTHFASHGFVTICVNSMSGGPGDPNNLKAMKDGLDWLIMQNSATGTFQNKLAVNRAVTMGYSIGATASVELSSHPAISTTVVIHGHNTKGDPHGPVLMITGTNDVIDDMRKTLTTLTEAPAVLVALPIGHLDVLTEISATGRYIAPITAWMRYWLHGDQAGKSFFWGDDCSMCKSPWIKPEPNDKWKMLML